MDQLQTQQPKKRKTWLIVLISILAAIIVLIGIFVWWLFGGSVGSPNKPAQEFINTLETNQVDEAYAQTAAIFKEATSPEDFKTFVEAFPILTTSNEAKFEGIERSTGDGQTVSILKGTLVAENGETSPLEVTLIAEDGEWRVATIDLRTDEARGQ